MTAPRRAAPLLVLAALLFAAPSAARPFEPLLTLADATLEVSEFPHPLEGLSGEVRLSRGIVSATPLVFRVLSSPFVARGFVAPGQRLFDVDVESPAVSPADFHRLLPELPLFRAAAPVAARVRFTRDGGAERRRFRLRTDRFRVDGSSVARHLPDVEGEGLVADATVEGKRKRVDELRFGLFGGAFSFRGDAETFKARLAGARVERALVSHPTLAGKLAGKLSVSAARKGGAVSGSFKLLDGSARDLACLAALARATRVDRLASLSFTELSASFTRRGDDADVRDLVFRSELCDLFAHARVAGKEGRLSGGGRLVVRLKLLAESRKLRRFGLLKDIMKRNTVTLKVKLAGTLEDPDLDVSL